MITAQVSLYPVESDDPDEVVNLSLQGLADHGVHWQVGPVSTEIQGEPEQVWGAIRSLFDQALAQGAGEVSMVVTVTNARP
ncbi:YkoF family thiamine/hydroxymethylpyrimidine-binding protein [Limnochorda pilosa]|uniref:YkoF family thiamine/hydroxymethylpyrimidine-binding protein n=1 Tax=Limnochorda pilosa TaxID=1555112 RepID=UPI0009E9690F